jgi:hypothetical protein
MRLEKAGSEINSGDHTGAAAKCLRKASARNASKDTAGK